MLSYLRGTEIAALGGKKVDVELIQVPVRGKKEPVRVEVWPEAAQTDGHVRISLEDYKKMKLAISLAEDYTFGPANQ